jgi:hypothetical protein
LIYIVHFRYQLSMMPLQYCFMFRFHDDDTFNNLQMMKRTSMTVSVCVGK